MLARFEYSDGRIVAVIDGEGNRTELLGRRRCAPGDRHGPGRQAHHDPLVRRGRPAGQVRRDLRRAHHVTELGYDAERNMTFRRDPSGHEWHATYVNGNLTSLQQPSGATTTVTYNSFGAPLVWTDPEGHATTYTWNPDGTLAGIEDALGHSETYTYTGGKQTGKVDRNGKAWAWTYTPRACSRPSATRWAT